jgi:hypothetical protein
MVPSGLGNAWLLLSLTCGLERKEECSAVDKNVYRMGVNTFANLNIQTRIKYKNTVKTGSVNRQSVWPASVCKAALLPN